jgi:quercetin dioxygenase-like cupin family protein
MFRWRGAPLGLTPHLASGVFTRERNVSRQTGKHFQTRLTFEGKTHFLNNLHVHRSLLMPGGGYEPHADPYDVMIVLLDGMVQTLGETMTAPAFFYHPAGSLHGIRALGEQPAEYLVVELHGSADVDRRGRRRANPNWSTADHFTAAPGKRWKAWRISPSV